MRKPYFILYIILLIFLTACGSNQHVSSDTGSVSFKLQLSRPTTTLRAAAATSADICTDFGITVINVNVFNSSGATVAAGNWSCSAHEGTITDVPAGADYTIRITGTVTGGTIAWRGEKSGVGVTAGETTPAGVITMAYTGKDITPPVITSTAPSPDANSVPVTTMITAKFSEKMATSSINTTNFTVKKGATPVSGSVVYYAGSLRSIFLPSGNLSYSTTYTATLTTDIEDMAGNKMESVYEWSFTTEDLPPPDTLPAVPAGLIAASGNSQITINWDAVPAATSYNIYWSATSGVTKTTGTKIPDITSTSYTHTGLTNGTLYYYIVTSVNSYGESVESYEISSAPGSIDSNPPTGSVTINNNAVYTTSTEVTLSLSSSSTRGISQMCISNTTPCSSWEPYTTSKSWPLTTGDGLRFVYAWFKDSTGTSNTSPYLAAITLDTKPPTDGTLTATAGDGQVSLNWSGFSDATSGIGGYVLVYSSSGTPDSCSSGTQIYAGSDTSYTHTGLTNGTTYYYRVCATDNAENASIGSKVSAMPSVGFALSGIMTNVRYIHQATRLADGRVLVTGGVGISGAMDSADIYDSSTGTFSQTGNMNMPRFSHTATLLSNGKVLIVGGRNNTGVENASSYLRSAELYDPVTGTFSYTGDMSISRQVHTATLLQDGKVLITGGAIDWNTSGGVATDIAEIYDPTSETFSRTGNLLKGNFFHTAALLDNGKVLISGGINSSAYVTDELYDPYMGTFTATGSMSRRRYYHAATKLSDGSVLITGGGDGTTASLQTAEVYDPATGTYSLVGNMNNRRNYHTSTLLSNGEVLITGGLDESGGNIVLNSAEIYDPATAIFSTAMNMADKRYLQTATPLIDGTVLIVGGDSGSGYLKSSEVYFP